jgi:hypothetical protein
MSENPENTGRPDEAGAVQDDPGAGSGAGQGVEQRPEKDPEDWVTGDEPMTGPQSSYLQTLCHEAGQPFNDKLTKAEASKLIDELQQRTGRDAPRPGGGTETGSAKTVPPDERPQGGGAAP